MEKVLIVGCKKAMDDVCNRMFALSGGIQPA